MKPFPRSLSVLLRLTVAGSTCFVIPSRGADDRVSWDNGGGDGGQFTNPANWSDFESSTPAGAASDQLPGWRSTGGNSNAIIQGGWANAVLSADFTPAFFFNPLIVRGGASLTINSGTLNIPFTNIEAGQGGGGGTGTITQNGGTVLGGAIYVVENNGANYNFNGGDIVVSSLNADQSSANGTGNFNFGPGGNGVGVSLRVTGSAEVDNSNNNVFTVGSGSTLSLGEASHRFVDGLTVTAGGTLSSGNNEAADPTITAGLLTLEHGSTIDFSINGEGTPDSDTWITSGGLSLNLLASYNLVVDAVAGSIELTDGDGLGDGLGGGGFWDIFSWSGGGGPTFAEFTATTWDISATENTRIGSLGTVEYFGNDTSGRIYLTGFSAFAIPEPSTAMLLVIASAAILLRRYRETMETRETPTAFFPRL